MLICQKNFVKGKYINCKYNNIIIIISQFFVSIETIPKINTSLNRITHEQIQP